MSAGAIATAIAAIVAAMGLLLTLMKLIAGQVESKLSARDAEQEKRIDALDAGVRANEKRISDTRTELHKEYVQHEQLERAIAEIKTSVGEIFKKIDAMARDLNVMRGSLQHRRSDDDG